MRFAHVARLGRWGVHESGRALPQTGGVSIGGTSDSTNAIPNIGSERAEIRRLLGSGIIIPDTNVCIDHLYYVTERFYDNAQEVLNYIEGRRENKADDAVHECLDEAMIQKRVKFPHVVSNMELDRQLKSIQEEALGSDAFSLKTVDVAAMMSRMYESRLFKYSKDEGHIRQRCTRATADRVWGMYDRFEYNEETKRAFWSIIKRGKKYPPKEADIHILAVATELAEEGADVRLLTLDSDFTEFAAQIERELRVKIIDGNPYIRKGKELADLKEYARAAEYLLEGTNLNRRSRYGLTYLAMALFRLGKIAEGKVLMNQITVDEGNFHSVVSMADLLMQAEEYDRAAASFGSAHRLKPREEYPLGRRGRALMLQALRMKGRGKTERLREARRSLQRSIQLNRRNNQAKLDLGTVNKELNRGGR